MFPPNLAKTKTKYLRRKVKRRKLNILMPTSFRDRSITNQASSVVTVTNRIRTKASGRSFVASSPKSRLKRQWTFCYHLCPCSHGCRNIKYVSIWLWTLHLGWQSGLWIFHKVSVYLSILLASLLLALQLLDLCIQWLHHRSRRVNVFFILTVWYCLYCNWVACSNLQLSRTEFLLSSTLFTNWQCKFIIEDPIYWSFEWLHLLCLQLKCPDLIDIDLLATLD